MTMFVNQCWISAEQDSLDSLFDKVYLKNQKGLLSQ